ncbi:MAG: 23S rRNA (uracil(1939)-C(5))-methyltransferase RlmD [Thermodesulfobacteriota bacterium]
MRKFEVHIESMAFKGYGVARLHGKVVFIPYTVTGDRGWIEMTEEKKHYSMGRLIQILAPSSWRVNPRCPWFGICGGCHWQHIDYLIQCNFKREILEDLLKRGGRLKEIPSLSVVPSPHPYGYRVRIQLKARGKRLGYFQEKSHRVVDIQTCSIAHPLINQMLSMVRKRLLPFIQTGGVEINVSPDENKGILFFPSLVFDQQMERLLEEILKNHPMVKGIVIGQKERLNLLGDPTLTFTIPLNLEKEEKTLCLQVSPGSFSQVNLMQNQRLIQTLLQWAEMDKVERALDLYCGIGNLTLPLAARGAKQVWGIEENQKAILDARFNAERNGIKNCEFIQGRVEEVLKDWKKGNPDVVVLDPPRRGCIDILEQMIRLKPRKIIYVSCEPTTFARDLRRLSESGYSLQGLKLIDMFPQTYHMELIGLLEPNERGQGA